MDLLHSYNLLSTSPDFGSANVYLGTGGRKHASLNGVFRRSLKLETGGYVDSTFDESGTRYITAESISFDLFVSIYDVNTTASFAFRTANSFLQKNLVAAVGKFLLKLKKPNIELRFIGLQNGSKDLSHVINELQKLTNGSLTEVDIFGNQIRHICIDMKTGVAYNLLLENRHYRPGELNNVITKDEFDRTNSQLDSPVQISALPKYNA